MTVTKNRIIAPLDANEVWGTHFSSRAWTSFQDQVDAGYPYVAQPTVHFGTWVSETIDYGRVIDACLINLSYLREDVFGVIPINNIIEWSEDAVAWETSEGVTQAYATNFRYVRITLEFGTVPEGTPMGLLFAITTDPSGGTVSDKDFVIVSNVRVKLDVKVIDDEGRDEVTGTASAGKVVEFNKAFVDIRAITITPEKDGDVVKVGVYDIDENPLLPPPTEMTVYLFDAETGDYVLGNFSWKIRGV